MYSVFVIGRNDETLWNPDKIFLGKKFKYDYY